jgi:SAM-dependent methyltransferase
LTAYSDFAEAVAESRWIFAKTMPQIPHWYTLRKDWRCPLPFEDAVQFIRDTGYRARWGRYNNHYLELNGMKYWTMGAPLKATILINRAAVEEPAPYDQIAAAYDGLHADAEALAENAAVIARLNYQGGSVLDVGAGTGLLLDYLQPEFYMGIDPSAKMLAELKRKHPDADVMQAKLERFWTPGRFDLAVSLFAPANYIEASALQAVPRYCDRWFFMFYREGYVPVTYERSGVVIEHFNHPRDVMPGRVSDFNNYFIIEGP